MKMKCIGLIVWVTFLLSLSARAEVIYVDLDDLTTDPGGNWNTIAASSANGTVNSLVDFDTGLITSVSYAGSGVATHASSGWTGGDIGWVDSDAAKDSFSGGSFTITFTGLSESNYAVELVSSRSSVVRSADITINAMFANRTQNGAGTSDDWDATDAENTSNWLIWDNVSAVADTLTLSFSGNGGEAIANSIKIVAIPEPVTVTLLSMAGFGLFITRRFRS